MMTIKAFKVSKFLAIGLLAVSLGACSLDMNQETFVNKNKIEVRESKHVLEMPVSKTNKEFYEALAMEYRKYGGGGLHLTFIYDPRSSKNNAISANKNAGFAKTVLANTGVLDTRVDILPVKDKGPNGSVLVTYNRYTAHAPKDCTLMPGIEGKDAYNDRNYKIGCSIDTMMARQVARPKDLLGQGGLPEKNVGSRDATRLTPYNYGLVNDELGGESVTGE